MTREEWLEQSNRALSRLAVDLLERRDRAIEVLHEESYTDGVTTESGEPVRWIRVDYVLQALGEGK